MRLRIPLLAGAVALLASGVAWADDAGGDSKPVADSTGKDTSPTNSEVIEVWEERKTKPFNRDTELRLSGEDLKERGATTLADALELLPDVYVREAGRGGRQIDVRGSRKGQVKILIDGVGVTDPYVGNFDLTSIPVTDIVQIRVSTSPASPIDGPGGSGAVIEVHTRSAVGTQMLVRRLQLSSRRWLNASVTGRSQLGEHLAVRISASMEFGERDIPLAMPYDGELEELRRGVSSAMRVEYRKDKRRAVVDLFAFTRRYNVAPAQGDLIASVQPETTGRIGLAVDDQVGKLRLRGNAYYHALQKTTLRYRDEDLTELVEPASDEVSADRAGVFALANRPVGKYIHVIGSTSFDTEDALAVHKDGRRHEGRVSIFSAATSVQFERGRLRVDAAGGVAVPIGVDASAWPEAKIVAKYRVAKPLKLEFTGARKGRTPTLRERFDGAIGNPDLGPEQALFTEVAAVMRPKDGMRVRMSSFVRSTTGTIRFDVDRGTLLNLGDLDVRGFDMRARFTLTKRLRVGGSVLFQDAYSEQLGSNPLDFLPRWRGDIWLKGRHKDKLGGWVRVRYIGEQIDRNQTLGRQVIVDASAYYALDKDLVATVRIDNSLNDDFDIRFGVANPGRAITLSLQGTIQ